MYKFPVLLGLFIFFSVSSFAQNGYYNLNGRKTKYRGSRVGVLGNYRLTPQAHYNAAKEAGKNLNAFYRDETGVGIVFAPATFTHHYTERDPKTDEQVFDTAYSISNAQSSGFIISEQTGYPLATFNSNSALLFTYGFSVRFINFKQSPIVINGVEREYGMSTTDFSAPLTLDYKSGGEAMLDRAKRTCFTIGVGFEPIWLSCRYGYTISYSKVRLLPIVKAEFGFVTRISTFKLRATANPVDFTYFDNEGIQEDFAPYKQSSFNISGKGQTTISLIVMLFSNKWDESESWYR